MQREPFQFIHFALNKELIEMYISMGLRSLALAMVGIFIPLYLFKELGYGIETVLLFYLIIYGVMALLTPICGIISSKIGLKHSILLSIPFSLSFIYLLNSLKYGLIHYSIVAIVEGIGLSLFWIAFHIDFAKCSDKKNRGKEVSIWFVSSLILSIIGPIVGGILLNVYGFSWLFIITGFLLFASVIPLFFSNENRVKYKFKLKNVFLKKHTREMINLWSYGIEGIGITIFWPLFVFLILKEYFALGIVSSIMGVISALFIPIVGGLNDKFGNKSLIRLGGVFSSFSWIIVSFVKTFWQIVFITGFSRLAFIMIDLPFSSFIYDKANRVKDKMVEYLVFREMMLFIGRAVILLSVIVFVNLFNLDFKDGLIFGFFIVGLSGLVHLKI